MSLKSLAAVILATTFVGGLIHGSNEDGSARIYHWFSEKELAPQECKEGKMLPDFDDAISVVDNICSECQFEYDYNYTRCRTNCYFNVDFDACVTLLKLPEAESTNAMNYRIRLSAARDSTLWLFYYKYKLYELYLIGHSVLTHYFDSWGQ